MGTTQSCGPNGHYATSHHHHWLDGSVRTAGGTSRTGSSEMDEEEGATSEAASDASTMCALHFGSIVPSPEMSVGSCSVGSHPLSAGSTPSTTIVMQQNPNWPSASTSAGAGSHNHHHPHTSAHLPPAPTAGSSLPSTTSSSVPSSSGAPSTTQNQQQPQQPSPLPLAPLHPQPQHGSTGSDVPTTAPLIVKQSNRRRSGSSSFSNRPQLSLAPLAPVPQAQPQQGNMNSGASSPISVQGHNSPPKHSNTAVFVGSHGSTSSTLTLSPTPSGSGIPVFGSGSSSSAHHVGGSGVLLSKFPSTTTVNYTTTTPPAKPIRLISFLKVEDEAIGSESQLTSLPNDSSCTTKGVTLKKVSMTPAGVPVQPDPVVVLVLQFASTSLKRAAELSCLSHCVRQSYNVSEVLWRWLHSEYGPTSAGMSPLGGVGCHPCSSSSSSQQGSDDDDEPKSDATVTAQIAEEALEMYRLPSEVMAASVTQQGQTPTTPSKGGGKADSDNSAAAGVLKRAAPLGKLCADSLVMKQFLLLPNDRIDNELLLAVASCSGAPMITALDLHATCVTDTTMKAIIERCTSLVDLCISQCMRLTIATTALLNRCSRIKTSGSALQLNRSVTEEVPDHYKDGANTSCLQHRRLKWGNFRATPILDDFLYLGDAADARSVRELKEVGIRRILSTAKECPPCDEVQSSTDWFTSKWIPLRDHSDEDIGGHLEGGVAFIRESMLKQEPLLVHCRHGVSRSATFVIAYLMQYGTDVSGAALDASGTAVGMSYQDAFDWVKARRVQVSPNLGFVLTLHDLDAELRGEDADPWKTASAETTGEKGLSSNWDDFE